MPSNNIIPPIPDGYFPLRDWRMAHNREDYPLDKSYHEGFAGIVGCTEDRWCRECEHRMDVPHRLGCSVDAKERAMVTPVVEFNPDTPRSPEEQKASHPMQPLVWDGDVIRFKKNKIVAFLLDAGPFDMNQLACMEFSDEDREQFAQLIGYSVGGYGELSYVSDVSYGQANQAREAFISALVVPTSTSIPLPPSSPAVQALVDWYGEYVAKWGEFKLLADLITAITQEQDRLSAPTPPEHPASVHGATSSVSADQTSKGPNGCERCGTGSQRHAHHSPTPPEPPKEQLYPCVKCSTMRTKAEGGTTFTVCEACWKESSTPLERNA